MVVVSRYALEGVSALRNSLSDIEVFFCVRPKGERKPNFVFASCVFRVGVPVYGYAEFFEIAVRTPKWPPRLIFAGACVGRETGANL